MASGADDEGAFTRLYAAERRVVHAYLLGRTGEPELAADLLQETFLRAWRNLATLRPLPPERARAWLFTVARNLVTDTHRSRRAARAAQAELGRMADPQAPRAEQPAQRAELAGDVARLDAAIRRLPEERRLVLALCTVGEMTSAQVGELLGRPPGTVRYELNQARRALAAALRESEE